MPVEPTPVPTPATPAAAAVADIPAPAATTPAVPLAPTGVMLTPEQWAAYSNTQARIAELEAAEHKRAAESRDAEIKALQAKGQIEQAFALQRQQAQAELDSERAKLKDTKERAKRYALDGELGRALSGHQLVVGGAEHLTRLLRDDFQVEEQGDSFVVRSKDFRPVGEYIGAMLGRPDYSCFVRAQNPGGGTAGGTAVQTPHSLAAQTVAEPQPRNLSEMILAGMVAAKKDAPPPTRTGGAFLQADGSVIREPGAAFGLRPLARQA